MRSALSRYALQQYYHKDSILLSLLAVHINVLVADSSTFLTA
jgi:hypothetical protein